MKESGFSQFLTEQSQVSAVVLWLLHIVYILRTFAQKFSSIDFFLKILPLKDDELVMSEM